MAVVCTHMGGLAKFDQMFDLWSKKRDDAVTEGLIKDLIQLSTPGSPVCARHKSAPSWCLALPLSLFARVTTPPTPPSRFPSDLLLITHVANKKSNSFSAKVIVLATCCAPHFAFTRDRPYGRPCQHLTFWRDRRFIARPTLEIFYTRLMFSKRPLSCAFHPIWLQVVFLRGYASLCGSTLSCISYSPSTASGSYRTYSFTESIVTRWPVLITPRLDCVTKQYRMIFYSGFQQECRDIPTTAATKIHISGRRRLFS